MRRSAATLLAVVLAAACRRAEPPRPVLLAAPAAVLGPGLVQHLVQIFTRQTGVAVEIRAVPPERLGADDADVVVAGDATTPQALRRSGNVRLQSTFAYDDFVIIGPPRDPAHVARAGNAAEAFRAIAARRRAFCAPVGVAALRERELAVWAAAGVDPHADKRYRDCGGDAAALLEEAAHREAYTLIGRSAAERLHSRKLKILLGGGPLLRDPFTIVLLRRPKPSRDAEWLVEWVMSYRGREAVQSYLTPDGRRFYFEAL